jgi:hypothetical protein
MDANEIGMDKMMRAPLLFFGGAFGKAMLPNEDSVLTPANDTCSIQSLFSAVSFFFAIAVSRHTDHCIRHKTFL